MSTLPQTYRVLREIEQDHMRRSRNCLRAVLGLIVILSIFAAL